MEGRAIAKTPGRDRWVHLRACQIRGRQATPLATGPFTSAGAPAAVVAAVLGLLAMGVQSAAVRLNLHGVHSTNVMTTNTTQLAIDVAQWLMAIRRASGPIPDAAARRERAEAAARIAALMPIMGAFLIGSFAGGIGFVTLGFWCLLPVILIMLAVIGWALWRAPEGI